MEGRDQPTRGRFDPPVIAFVNEEGQPCTYYQVTKDKRIHTNFDPSKSLYPDPDYFRTTLQQIDFLRAGMDAETISQGQDLETAKEERDYLLKKARPETVKGFQSFITEGMNPENIENFCSTHAREKYNTGSVVIFEG
jgi:hypothetical protein